MASVSVYRNSAKYQEFHPAHQGHWVTACASPLVTQQKPDSAGSGKLNIRCQSKPLVNTTLYKGMCQNSPLPTPLVLPPILSHPFTFRAVPGSTRAVIDATPSTFLETAVAQSRAVPGTKRKPSGHVLRNSDRYI